MHTWRRSECVFGTRSGPIGRERFSYSCSTYEHVLCGAQTESMESQNQKSKNGKETGKSSIHIGSYAEHAIGVDKLSCLPSKSLIGKLKI